MPDTPDLRAAFLGSSYGRAGERLTLSPRGPGALPDCSGPDWSAPSWTAPGGRWAIVTAWNPAGRMADAVLNARRQAELAGEVGRWSPLPGWNGDGEWREDTLILRGVPLREAARLGRRFGQAAVVWGVGRRAALVWLDDRTAPTELRTLRLWLRRADSSGADSPGTADCGYTAGL
ncbi:DUF3293 domain-containing protein [Deinococcus sp. JMULE3]|uniref:DUF3293 domain-containing protein n=1 Tax=Deinococcus sp. JMULE3 TaxID=2518341 RepID=UPI0015769180|nr:DUF3293 domain-containing protein [Deinococcus sp. JMULE3]NTX99552.1 DUF3293 domain-containing protein [Deinococcus sp. JMULE3]